MDNDVVSVNPKDENDVYFYDPNHTEASLLKLLDGRKLVDNHCDDKTYNADAVIITHVDGGIFVGMLLEPIDSKDDDARQCPWYMISSETDDDGGKVKSFSPLEEKLSSFDTMFHEKNVFLTQSIGNFPLRTLMKSFDTASVVGTDLPDDAKYDHVDNHDAELTCNIVTDLGIKVDDDVIAMIKSSIRVGAPKFYNTVQSKGSTLTDVILWCLDEPKSSKNKTKSSKKK